MELNRHEPKPQPASKPGFSPNQPHNTASKTQRSRKATLQTGQRAYQRVDLLPDLRINLIKTALRILIVSVLAFSFVMCASSKPAVVIPEKVVKRDTADFESEGWLNDHIYQVRAEGKPTKATTGFVDRRNEAEERAVVNAQRRMIELLVDKRTAESFRPVEPNKTLTPEFEKALLTGAILKKSFDNNDICAITYRIEVKDLRKMALTR